jgi:putative aldouronate transport system permease protein
VTNVQTVTSQKSVKTRFVHLMKEIWKYKAIYILLLPGIAWYIMFAYLPLGGLSLAFKTYNAKLGILGSPWCGFQNFEYVFRDATFWASLQRTIIINFGRLIFQFPAPILVALMLNEVRVGRYKKILQSIFTFPHFLSWVIVASIMTNLLSFDGLVNSFITICGGQTINFLGSEKGFQPLLYISEIWKSSGYSAIIYLAAISGIDQDQYEAAEIDGASRLQRVMRITLPNILPTISVLFVMTAGNLMSAGFDQIFNLSNAAVKNVAETLDMYIYRVTFQSATDFGFSMAVSLFRSICNMILLVCADRGSKAMGGSGLFG